MNGKTREDTLNEISALYEQELARRDSIAAASLDSVIFNQSNDTSEVNYMSSDRDFPDMGLEKTPGIREGTILDMLFKAPQLVGKGIKMQSEISKQQAISQARMAQDLSQKLEPVKEGALNVAKTLKDSALSGDYWRAATASALGAPVDLASGLLYGLGVEMPEKPFFGRQQLKESLDKLAGEEYSDKFLLPFNPSSLLR
tara:strand:- start:4709 stop:5308 length:600 start_codon:yes stop_codon:yes gene_type:complete